MSSITLKSLVFRELLNFDRKQSGGDIQYITKTFFFIEKALEQVLNQHYKSLAEQLQSIAGLFEKYKGTQFDPKSIKTFSWLEQRMMTLARDQLLQWEYEKDLEEDMQVARTHIQKKISDPDCSVPDPKWNYDLGPGRLCYYREDMHEVIVKIDESMIYPQYCTRLIPFMHEFIHAYTRDGSMNRGGFQPPWFREGAAFFLSREFARGEFFSVAQSSLWRRVEEPFYLCKEGEPTLYDEGLGKVESISIYAENNDMDRIDFVLQLAKNKGKVFEDGRCLHDVVLTYIQEEKNKDDILALFH